MKPGSSIGQISNSFGSAVSPKTAPGDAPCRFTSLVFVPVLAVAEPATWCRHLKGEGRLGPRNCDL